MLITINDHLILLPLFVAPLKRNSRSPKLLLRLLRLTTNHLIYLHPSKSIIPSAKSSYLHSIFITMYPLPISLPTTIHRTIAFDRKPFPYSILPSTFIAVIRDLSYDYTYVLFFLSTPTSYIGNIIFIVRIVVLYFIYLIVGILP